MRKRAEPDSLILDLQLSATQGPLVLALLFSDFGRCQNKSHIRVFASLCLSCVYSSHKMTSCCHSQLRVNIPSLESACLSRVIFWVVSSNRQESRGSYLSPPIHHWLRAAPGASLACCVHKQTEAVARTRMMSDEEQAFNMAWLRGSLMSSRSR